jgi:beta-1,3-galactosyltransferase 1
MARVNRNPNNKWFVAKELFVGEKTYPEYCEGFMVAFSNDLLPSLFKSAMLTPFFWIDDVYLYGLVPRNIPGVHYTNLTFENDVLWGIDKIKECLKKETKCNHYVFLLLKHSSLKVRSMWALVLNQKTKQN